MLTVWYFSQLIDTILSPKGLRAKEPGYVGTRENPRLVVGSMYMVLYFVDAKNSAMLAVCCTYISTTKSSASNI